MSRDRFWANWSQLKRECYWAHLMPDWKDGIDEEPSHYVEWQLGPSPEFETYRSKTFATPEAAMYCASQDIQKAISQGAPVYKGKYPEGWGLWCPGANSEVRP